MGKLNSSAKPFGLIVVSVMLSVMIAGCGPTKQEIAAREAARKAKEQEILQIKAKLRKSAQLREASGERIPPRVEDPGYKVRECIVKPKLPQGIGFISSGCGSSVCGNTTAGSKIVAWRKWYCEGADLTQSQYERCVLAEWKGGEPTFWSVWRYNCSSAIKFEGDPVPRVVDTAPFKLE